LLSAAALVHGLVRDRLGPVLPRLLRQVFRWLQPFRKGGTPRRTALCEARKRLGIAPMRLLAEQAIQLQGKPTTPGAFYRGMRTMALDVFIVDVPDSPAHVRAFGRPGSSRAPAAFPQARVLALCETGSHVLWRCLIKPCSCGEVTMTHYLLRFLRPDMLLLWDRNFLSYQSVSEVRQRKAHLLARIKKDLIFEPIRVLNDGSYLSKIYRHSADRKKDRNGILVRIIESTFDDPVRPGSGEPHRLLTTLLDEKLDPAGTLIVGDHGSRSHPGTLKNKGGSCPRFGGWLFQATCPSGLLAVRSRDGNPTEAT
jgi:hypothetical protein